MGAEERIVPAIFAAGEAERRAVSDIRLDRAQYGGHLGAGQRLLGDSIELEGRR